MAFHIGKDCQIHPSAVIDVKEGFLGDGALIREGTRIEGHCVEIGREAYLDRGAMIGGGSCFDPDAKLVVGDWLHMGWNSQINIARGVTVGHEFGCGIETKIFTHGAYMDSYALGAPVQWAPVTIGDHVWMPNAWVKPGVAIGDRVVIAARSLVNRDIPARALAGGVPAKVIKENYFPRVLSADEKREHLKMIVEQAWSRYRAQTSVGAAPEALVDGSLISCSDGASFELEQRTMAGPVTEWNTILKDQLRRNGIRFRYSPANGEWTSWKQSRFEI